MRSVHISAYLNSAIAIIALYVIMAVIDTMYMARASGTAAKISGSDVTAFCLFSPDRARWLRRQTQSISRTNRSRSRSIILPLPHRFMLVPLQARQQILDHPPRFGLDLNAGRHPRPQRHLARPDIPAGLGQGHLHRVEQNYGGSARFFPRRQPPSPPTDFPAPRLVPDSPTPSATLPHPAIAQRGRFTYYMLLLTSEIPKMVALKPPAANAFARHRRRIRPRCRNW